MILDRLRRLSVKHPVIGQVRGHGFMIGIEFVQPDCAPDTASCEKVINYCLEEGLILINCGIDRNIIRCIPPLTTTDQELDTALTIFEEGVRRLA
jgi:4-aminobutyrate aminotransferase